MIIHRNTIRTSVGEVGFCGGVSRADAMIQKIRESEEGDIFIFGDLIHNRFYKEQLLKERVFSIDSIEEAKDRIVIIRTHGMPPEEENRLRTLAKKVYDLTCPLVKVIQEKAEAFSRKGYIVLITGDPFHAETRGIMGYADDIFAIKVEKDLDKLPFADFKEKNVVLLSQSTFGQDQFTHLSHVLKEKIPHLLIENTLCYAPTQRQEEISALVQENDMIIVIGGVHSSNTIKLYEKAMRESDNGKVYHIETADELDGIDFAGVKTVGIASGTSTPDALIQELVEKLEAISMETSSQS